jgi:hypothetical protein
VARIEFTKDSLSPTLKTLMPTLNRNIYQVMRFHAPSLEAKAKTDARWTDRTTNARSSLNATVVVEGKHQYALVLAGGVKYQIWLEVRFAGRYAIIMPTIKAYAPVVMASFTKLLERMGVAAG